MADEPERKPPTLRDLAAQILPPGVNGDALWASLRGSQVGPAADYSRPVPQFDAQRGRDYREGLKPQQMMCLDCRRLIPAGDDGPCPGHGKPPLPPLDPFTPGAEASAALAEMYSDMCASGIPVASVESILGHMLAAYQLGKDGVQ